MKAKVLQFASLLLVATACSQEELRNFGPREATISAVMEGETRSHATDEGAFTWTKGDEISVYTSSGNFRTFALNGEGGTATANFKGILLNDETITQCAAYPNNENHKLNGNTFTFNLPDEYGDFETEYVPNTNAPMIALVENSTDFNFKHLGGVLRFKLNNVPVDATQFVFTAADKDITGEFDVDLTASTPTISTRSKTTANSVTIKFKPLTSVQNDMTFFVPLPVGTYNGFSIAILKQDDTRLLRYTHSTSNTMERKTLARFSKLTFADVTGSLEEDGVTEDITGEDGSIENGGSAGSEEIIPATSITLAQAGTLREKLGDQVQTLISLKIIGEINGTDIKCLRQMAGCSDFSDLIKGNLTVLDLSEASIVEGGDAYKESYKTVNNEIGEHMFYESDLQMIIFQNSLTAIGTRAFCACHNLTNVTIGNSVTTIGEWAFNSCDNLTNVTIPNSVITIGRQAFSNCGNLTNVTIGNSVTTIGVYAFSGCINLTNVTIPNSVTTIEGYAFSECDNFTNVTIGSSVTTIGDRAFSGCDNLTNVTIPNSVITIGEWAFSGCANLTNLTIGNSVTTIGGSAFSRCSKLSEVTSIAATPPELGNEAFTIANTLKVPKDKKATYQETDWKNYFTTIEELAE